MLKYSFLGVKDNGVNDRIIDHNFIKLTEYLWYIITQKLFITKLYIDSIFYLLYYDYYIICENYNYSLLLNF